MSPSDSNIRQLTLPIDRCAVIRDRHRDRVLFHVADDLGPLHGPYEAFNERDLRVDTVLEQGPALARILGWTGPIQVVDEHGDHPAIPATDPT